MKPIYLDYNATTPIDPRVAEAMTPYIHEYFGNPSSGHGYGVQTKIAVEKARRQVAAMLNCEAEEIIFTSGVRSPIIMPSKAPPRQTGEKEITLSLPLLSIRR